MRLKDNLIKQVIVPAMSYKKHTHTHKVTFDGCQNMKGSVICGGLSVLILLGLHCLFAFYPRVDN